MFICPNEPSQPWRPQAGRCVVRWCGGLVCATCGHCQRNQWHKQEEAAA